ncbi:MAG: hypothetical protein KGR26_14515, partial [Cyanobacteria bacterium REEB65]|nr:hypothetical protein [Cyanobacteria bacterium REEB65]
AAATLVAGLLVAPPAWSQMVMSSGSSQAAASAPSRPGDSWTGGGLLFAPRYLSAGSGQIGIGPAFMFAATPSVPASPLSGALGVDYAIADGSEIFAVLGPVTLAGYRGRLMQNDYGAVGWALDYRADTYPAMGNHHAGPLPAGASSSPTTYFQGLNAAPILGGMAIAQGAELRVDAMQNLGPIDLYVSPKLSAMSIGLKPGLGLGIDVDLGRIVLGYDILGQANVSPASSAYNAGFEIQHGLGGRVILTDNLYLQADWFYQPQDDLYNAEQGMAGGIGYQWGGAAATPAAGMQMSK